MTRAAHHHPTAAGAPPGDGVRPAEALGPPPSAAAPRADGTRTAEDDHAPEAKPELAAQGLRLAHDLVNLVIAPVTVVTALLYYFGWVRTGAFFSTFGIEQQLLGYSPQDYVLRSAGVAFRPAAWGLLGAAGALAAVWLVRVMARRFPSRATPLRVAMAATGTTLLLVALAVLLGIVQTTRPLAAAVSLAVGAVLLHLAAEPAPASVGRSVPLRLLLGGTLALAAFWACAVYAQASGRALANAYAQNPTLRPGVVVYSEQDLQLTGPSISHDVLASGETTRHRYTGLRLLMFSDERWFLIPERWATDGSTSSVVLDDERLRVELAPAG